MADQRYVSNELTHFVGRGLEPGNQYRVLREILISGRLRTRSSQGKDVDSHGVHINKEGRLSEDEMYAADVVCFCDIPLQDLPIHMRKYSYFGVAFLRSFMVKKGASPVFYQAKTAPLIPLRSPSQSNSDIVDMMRRAEAGEDLGQIAGEMIQRLKSTTRAEQFDRMIPDFRRLLERLRDLHRGDGAEPAPLYWEIRTFLMFLDFDVFSNVKFFDDSLPEDDSLNYYMEREWRLFGDVEFALEDVRRIILPEESASSLHADFPQFAGQVTFSPT